MEVLEEDRLRFFKDNLRALDFSYMCDETENSLCESGNVRGSELIRINWRLPIPPTCVIKVTPSPRSASPLVFM